LRGPRESPARSARQPDKKKSTSEKMDSFGTASQAAPVLLLLR
jgi:hypothetical protein